MGQPTELEQQHATHSATARHKTADGFSPREVRRALWCIIVAWVFGAGFVSLTGGAPLSSFLVKYLKADDFSFGLVMAAGPAVVFLQFFGSLIIERTGRVKRNFLIYVTAGRLLWLGAAAIALFMPIGKHAFAQVALIGLVACSSTALMNFGGAGWPTWMSEVVPTAVAGKFFGYRAQLGLISMALTAIGAAALIDRYHDAGWCYALVFGLGALLGAADILCFIPVRERPRPVEPAPPTLKDILVTPWRNALFRGVALYTSVAWIAYMMMGPFVARYCLEQPAVHGLGMSVSTTNMLLFIVPWVSMALVSPFWGMALDRFGPKPVLALSSLCAALVPIGWACMQPSLSWSIVVLAAFSGLTWPGIDQSILYMQVKSFPAERHTAYNATFLSVSGLATMLGTAFGGWYAGFWQHHLHVIPLLPAWVSHYHPVFVTSLLLRLAAFFFLLPRLQLAGTAGVGTVTRALLADSLAFLPRIMRGVRVYAARRR